MEEHIYQYTSQQTKKINFLGLELDNKEEKELKARVCPKCGKVEFYIDPKEKRLINL